jgi:hypothetical protein
MAKKKRTYSREEAAENKTDWTRAQSERPLPSPPSPVVQPALSWQTPAVQVWQEVQSESLPQEISQVAKLEQTAPAVVHSVSFWQQAPMSPVAVDSQTPTLPVTAQWPQPGH